MTGLEGAKMVCADGLVRQVYPILATFIGDYPKQCLIAYCAENHCPKCHVPADQCSANSKYPPRDQT
ncbi:hypothetical protein J3R82DRAFT_6233 [Butyriboletus roseoflavus]|nr:hypothetical protein J3R82DRAFT_6233 [Butyriboletus roseoflavus]